MGSLDAAALAGLLADDDRRLVVAALTLGATCVDAVVTATSLPSERVTRALGRLRDGGLVVVGDDGGLEVLGATFQHAARVALSRLRREEHADEPDERRKVLDAFVQEGRITGLPAARAKRTVLLDWLAQDFEPGRRYAERQVNEIIEHRDADTATLRRSLVDEGLLDRADGEYWRIGGTVT